MIDEYEKALKAGEKEYKTRIAAGEYPYVPALDDICPENEVLTQRQLGMMEIPLDLVVGTKTRARQNSFAPGFMPLIGSDSEFAIKWESLYRSQISEGLKEPVKVYEYLHRFYVQEGNKRVSVSRFLEMPTIMANVIRVTFICVIIHFFGGSAYYVAHTYLGRILFYALSVGLYFYVFTKEQIVRQKVGGFSYDRDK